MSAEHHHLPEDTKNIVDKIGSFVIGVIGWLGEVLGIKHKNK